MISGTFFLLCLEVSVDGEFFGCLGCFEKETGQIADDKDDEVAIYPEHVFVMGKVPLPEIKERLFGTVAIHVNLCRCEHSVCGENHSGSDTDVKSLLVCPSAKQSEHKDTNNASRENSI